jgi:hypothetical protein
MMAVAGFLVAFLIGVLVAVVGLGQGAERRRKAKEGQRPGSGGDLPSGIVPSGMTSGMGMTGGPGGHHHHHAGTGGWSGAGHDHSGGGFVGGGGHHG